MGVQLANPSTMWPVDGRCTQQFAVFNESTINTVYIIMNATRWITINADTLLKEENC